MFMKTSQLEFIWFDKNKHFLFQSILEGWGKFLLIGAATFRNQNIKKQNLCKMVYMIEASFISSCNHIRAVTETRSKQEVESPGSRSKEALQWGREINNHPEMVGSRKGPRHEAGWSPAAQWRRGYGICGQSCRTFLIKGPCPWPDFCSDRPARSDTST